MMIDEQKKSIRIGLMKKNCMIFGEIKNIMKIIFKNYF